MLARLYFSILFTFILFCVFIFVYWYFSHVRDIIVCTNLETITTPIALV